MKQHVLWSEIPIAQDLTKVFSCVWKHILISLLFLSRSQQLWYKSWLGALWSMFFTTSASADHEDMFDLLDINIVCFSWKKTNQKQYLGWSSKENACKIFVCVCASTVKDSGVGLAGNEHAVGVPSYYLNSKEKVCALDPDKCVLEFAHSRW